MRIAVTGASGTIGSAVVAAALTGGHAVLALDRATAAPPDLGLAGAGDKTALPTTAGAADARPDIQRLDVTDLAAFTTAIGGCDALIHLAAIPGPRRNDAHEVHNNNVLGSYHAFLAAAEVGIHRVAWASSINAIGGFYSRTPKFDYFPVDEDHPSYAEDAYSLSKWLGEQQAESVVRLHPEMSIASIRLHGARASSPTVQPRSEHEPDEEHLRVAARHLWGWVHVDAVARAFLLALTSDFDGHEEFLVVAPTTTTSVPSAELCRRFYPDVPLRRPIEGTAGLYDCGKAAKLLGWTHDA